MSSLLPELAAFSHLLDTQPAQLRDAFTYCLVIAIVQAGFVRLAETTRGEAGPICTFETITGERFSLTRPPMSKKMEAEVLEAGRIIPVDSPQTIADGLRTSLGTLTFPIIREYVDAIVTVNEAAIVEAMRYVWERAKLIIEPSAAVPLAALFTKRVDIPGDRIGVLLSGGNVDLECLPWTKK